MRFQCSGNDKPSHAGRVNGERCASAALRDSTIYLLRHHAAHSATHAGHQSRHCVAAQPLQLDGPAASAREAHMHTTAVEAVAIRGRPVFEMMTILECYLLQISHCQCRGRTI